MTQAQPYDNPTAQKQHLSIEFLEEVLKSAFPERNVLGLTYCSGPSSYIVRTYFSFEDDAESFYILKVSLIPGDLLAFEKAVIAYVSQEFPTPSVEKIGNYEGYEFSIQKLTKGIFLRDIIEKKEEDLASVMGPVGNLLAKFRDIPFSKIGKLDSSLNVTQVFTQVSMLKIMETSLKDKTVIDKLGKPFVRQARILLNQFACYFPDGSEKHLVHGSWNPDSIVMLKDDEGWRVIAVLNWEMSYSGSAAADVSCMLEGLQECPEKYRTIFFKSLERGGLYLKDNWELTGQITNLMLCLEELSDYYKSRYLYDFIGVCSIIKALERNEVG